MEAADNTEAVKKIRIALIDDHTLFRSGLKALLTRQNDFEIVGEARRWS